MELKNGKYISDIYLSIIFSVTQENTNQHTQKMWIILNVSKVQKCFIVITEPSKYTSMVVYSSHNCPVIMS